MGLFDNYLNAFNKTLSVSMFDHDKAPNYQLLSEGLAGDGEESPFASAFTDMNPINELRPAENIAQRWDRKSKEADGIVDGFDRTDANLFVGSFDYMPRVRPVANFDEHLYFTNLYSGIIGNAILPKGATDAPKTPRTPQGVDISSLTPQDEWDDQFKKNQPFKSTIASSGAAGGGLTSGKAGSGLKSNPANSAQQTKRGDYADRTAFAKRMEMSPTGYFNFFGRTNASL